MILSSLETAEQIASRMKYASVATQLAVSTTINKDEKTTLTVNHKGQEVNEDEGPTDTILSDTEETLYDSVQTQISNGLRDDEHNNASDVYGGVTFNEIVGKWDIIIMDIG